MSVLEELGVRHSEKGHKVLVSSVANEVDIRDPNHLVHARFQARQTDAEQWRGLIWTPIEFDFHRSPAQLSYWTFNGYHELVPRNATVG